ncbi:HsdM family class I SAM-dependent methyltransferase [Neisseria sp. Ec49-e6-T10]|uniref:HsdM family class I SAM-dependent methyltransferase n=1 Tax=Neisseria sp. Ec49-e6-T10 TaxID=3140744 RepID=UPI003EBA55DD
MKRKILNFLRSNNLVDEKLVNSLITSLFIHENQLSVSKNRILLDTINYDFPNKTSLKSELLQIINDEETPFNFEMLIQLFEFVISPSNRIVNGAIYTPKNIRSFIIESVIDIKNDSLFLPTYKIADLSCGCGAFLVDVAHKLKQKSNLSYYQIFKENLYGIDIESYAVRRSKILLSLLALWEGEDDNFEFNLFVGDSLKFNWKTYFPYFSGFDIIVGNPPYVTAKHMAKETREILTKMQTCQIGSPDLYIPFFEIGIENLASDGQLGFITMNSFFKSLNARNLRQYFYNKSLNFNIIDFGAEQIFQSRNTYTCICIISNKNSRFVKYIKTKSHMLQKDMAFKQIPYENLNAYTGWNLHSNELIKKIESVGTPLGEKYKTSHGLATLKNDLYIFTPIRETKEFYYLKAKDNQEYPIEKNICVNVINSNKLSRVASIDNFQEKLIFPYTNEKYPKILDEVIFKKNFPLAYQYLKNHSDVLALRDKGKGKYQAWYAFGRTQGLEQIEHKMFFPKYSDIIPHYLIHSDKRTYFYNGQAFLGNSVRELQILKKILETRLFWFYISSTSKPYASNYYSLNGTYIKNFGICDLAKEEEDFILKETNRDILDSFFEEKYKINLGMLVET